MIGHITEWILEALRTNGGWSVFWGVLIEQVIVPIPSPAIIMGAGFILIPAESTWSAALIKSSLEIVFPGVLASTMGAIARTASIRWACTSARSGELPAAGWKLS